MLAIQVAYEFREPKTKGRELAALIACMKDLEIDVGYIITYEYEAEETSDGKKIYYVPAYKWLFDIG